MKISYRVSYTLWNRQRYHRENRAIAILRLSRLRMKRCDKNSKQSIILAKPIEDFPAEKIRLTFFYIYIQCLYKLQIFLDFFCNYVNTRGSGCWKIDHTCLRDKMVLLVEPARIG